MPIEQLDSELSKIISTDEPILELATGSAEIKVPLKARSGGKMVVICFLAIYTITGG
ncbi:MAG: hypothetical protein CM1200mP22_32570 [Dehalococcoidia bacterium]|nr:MAG: hypothetical protein CM1200mP22_32570 [Dehalococcoidia bacterium]